MKNYIDGLVSVIIPTYRRADQLSKAIESVLGQTYKNIECIVVNDNTPNDKYSLVLYELIKQYTVDDRFSFIEQKKHINGAEARNCGIRNAKGEYIAFLDDDDWWKAEKIDHQVAFLKKQSAICGGVSTLVEFYSDGKVIRWTRPYKDGKIYLQILRREIDVTTCSVLLRHNALDETGYFDNTLKRHQEIQLFSYFTSKYELKLLSEYLTCVNYDSNDNRPTSDQLIAIKKDFFKSVNSLLIKLNKAERKSVYTVHNLEVALVEYKERKYAKAFIKCIKAVMNPRTLVITIKLIRQRKLEYIKPKM